MSQPSEAKLAAQSEAQSIMQSLNHQSTQAAQPPSSWLDNLEIASVAVSIGSSILLTLTNQIVLATIPLSFTAAINLANRKRLINAVMASQQAATVQLVGQLQQQQQTLESQRQADQAKFAGVGTHLVEMQELSTAFSQQLQALDEKGTNIETVLEKLREIDRFTQVIRTNPNAAEPYFNRGQVRQSLSRMEDNRLAIEDYTQAVKMEPGMAKAYFNRGLIRAELGERRQAGEDLRLAAKCYFDLGEMDHYAEAKRRSEAIYDKAESSRSDVAEAPIEPKTESKLLVSDLFM
jgi:tetratricopeptide (TPR) repeat protein